MSRHDKIVMDLIAAYQHVVGKTDFVNALQLFDSPDTSRGIMWTAQDAKTGIGKLCLGFKIFKINGINTICIDQGRRYQLAAVALGCKIHGVIYRRHQKNAIARFGKGMDGAEEGMDNTGGINDPFRGSIPVVMTFHPLYDTVFICWRGIGIAKNALVKKVF